MTRMYITCIHCGRVEATGVHLTKLNQHYSIGECRAIVGFRCTKCRYIHVLERRSYPIKAGFDHTLMALEVISFFYVSNDISGRMEFVKEIPSFNLELYDDLDMPDDSHRHMGATE